MAKSKKVEEQQIVVEDEEQQGQSQTYDASMKELVDRQVKDIVAALLPGASYEDTLNVEIARPLMRTDKVYIIVYRGKKHILHLEFESGKNKRMGARMLAYNAALHLKYNLPVISIVVYLFKTSMAISPFVLEGGDGTITTFHFRILPLFLLNARHYVSEHITCMYPLLPTMQGITHELLLTAMKEMEQVYKDDNDTLSDFFAYMVILLERVETIAPLEKARMKEVLNMYGTWWDESPLIQHERAISKVETLRNSIVKVVGVRFPHLADLARKKVTQISDFDKLDELLVQISTSPDEASVRSLLAPTAA
ncbi:hypothetical protein KSF_024590 [Reticulibacter mediterranei]|uniref:Transposase (putative) YhgA-like domain-containing protein n=1 Tax=Reticulibacter mediterranei TaxID=2778369 RepID=A0A8J3IDP0_9CHLR|nr:hypothetical protein [Reticulibacter mediterranei]GHO92411.1 hypothetical protein KSF_024590 [Reticulibacter mediterranei]